MGKTPISPTFKAVRPGLFGGGHGGPGGGGPAASRRYSCSSSLDNHNDVFTFSRTQTASYCDVNSPSSYPSSLRGSPAPYSGSDSISPPTPPMSPAAIGSGGHMGSPLRVSARRMLPETPKQRELPSRSVHQLIFFCFLFCEKSLICLEGKSMTPSRGNTILFRSSQQLPRLRLGPSKGFLS